MDYEILNYNTDKARITENDLNDVENIYQESFPENEKDMTIREFIAKSEKDNRLQLLIMYADPLENGKKEVVAFDLIIVDKEFVYTIFLGSKKQYGIKGYGRKLGTYVRDELTGDRYFFFIAEKIEDTAENKEERRKRKLFFHRNKLFETGCEIYLDGVNFEFYSKGQIPHEDCLRFSKIVKEIYYN